MLAGYILHLIKLLSEQVRSLFFGYYFNYLVQKEYGIENPGFHRIPAMIQSCGLPVHPIPLDDKGIHISALRESSTCCICHSISPIPTRNHYAVI